MDLSVPLRMETPRLVLRRWETADAPRLKDAIDSNLEHLQAWMPWAMDEPSPLDVLVARIETFHANAASGSEWLFAILTRDESRVIGGTGLHADIGDGGLEIGYWAQAAETGKGFVTEAVDALTRMALALPGIDRVEIRCDPGNVASAAVARRLGYLHIITVRSEGTTPAGTPRDTMVWQKSRPLRRAGRKTR
jgi:RimJ/RimL family protein N-acetyltransferase